MLERFHQSFFFYLHINHRTFVSIATYMVPLGLMVLPAIVRSLVLYMSFLTSSSTTTAITHGRTMKFHIDYTPIFIEIFKCIAMSYALTWIPLKLSVLGISVLLMLISPFVLRRYRSNIYQFDYFQFIILLLGSALLGCLSLLNYSMAFLTACFLMPCYMVAGFSKLDYLIIKLFCRFTFITFLNPLVFLAFYHYLTRIITAGQLLYPDFVQFSNDLDTYFASYHLFNTWTVDVVCVTIVPIWLSLYRSTYWSRI